MLGFKIKTFRKNMGLTLYDLGKKAGITASYLSQVERDLAEPSLSALRKIAKALNVPVYKFLIEDDEDDQFIIRRDERKTAKVIEDRAIYQFITPVSKDQNNHLSMLGITATLAPGAYDESQHHAEEMILVIKGVLEITIEDEVYILNDGDSIYLKENIHHVIKNIGDEPLEVLSCISPSIYK